MAGMFGFWGHWSGVIEYDAPGVASGAQRLQHAMLGTTVLQYVPVTANFDVNGDGAPNSYQGMNPSFPIVRQLSTANVSYFTPWSILSDIYGLPSVKAIINAGGTRIGGVYNSAAALTPRTRKVRMIVHRPDLLHSDSFGSDNNDLSKQLANNPREGASFDYRQFPNIRTIAHGEGFVSSLSRLPGNVIVLYMAETPNLSSIPTPLPNTIEMLALSEVAAGVSSNINSILAGLTKIKSLMFVLASAFPSTMVRPTTTLSGTLDLTDQVALEEFAVSPFNTNLTAITFAPGLNTLRHLYIASSGVTSTSMFDSILANNPNLISYIIMSNNNSTWTRNFVSADIPSSLRYLWVSGSKVSGSININSASPKPNLLDIRTNSTSGTTINSIDVTGLTGARYMDFTGCAVQSLELPVNTVCNTLRLFNNQLDYTVNTNLLSQVNAMTALTSLFFGNQSTTSAGAVGQSSTNGLGTVNISSLVNLLTLALDACKLTGTLTLPNVNKLTSISLSNNPNLTSIANLLSHTGLLTIQVSGCTTLSFAITNVFTAISTIFADACAITSVDLSGRTSTGAMNRIEVSNTSTLTTVTFPASQANGICNIVSIRLNSSLATVSNETNIVYNTPVAANRQFLANDCPLLNRSWAFGANNFLPGTINIANCGMSQANVDSTIDSIYTNRAKSWGTGSRVLTINGSNAAPSGTYQAPAGFVLGSNDGTPASAKEQAYVLVNNYSWTILMN